MNLSGQSLTFVSSENIHGEALLLAVEISRPPRIQIVLFVNAALREFSICSSSRLGMSIVLILP